MILLIVLAALVAPSVAEGYEDREYYRYRGPSAPLNSDGMVMDTPEVASARAAHLAMHAQALARLRKAQNDYDAYERNDAAYARQMMDPMEAVMQKRPRQMMLEQLGRVESSPAMTEVTVPHTANRARAASKASEFYEFDIFDGRKNILYLSPVRVAYKHAPSSLVYRGPMAPLGADGRVVDTPEVQRAREAHMKAHARAMALPTQNDLYY